MEPPGCQVSTVFGRLPVIRVYYRSIVFRCQGGFTVQAGCSGSRHQVQIPGRRVKVAVFNPSQPPQELFWREPHIVTFSFVSLNLPSQLQAGLGNAVFKNLGTLPPQIKSGFYW